jgi:hypothetical protein
MGSALDLIVPISIKFGSVNPTGTAFGIPMIAAQFLTSKTTLAFTRIRKYYDLAGMLSDGWLTTDKPYMAAQDMLAFNPCVPYFYIGRNDSSDANWGAALDAINAEDAGWYGFVTVPIVATTAGIILEQLAVTTWAKTQVKLNLTQSSDATILAAGSSDAASQILALSSNRTGVIYHGASATEYADAAWLGVMLVKAPGSASFAYKDPSNGGAGGVTPDNLTPSQKSIAWGKLCTTFSKVAGVPVTERGFVANAAVGSYGFLDITVGIDWVTSNIQTAIFQALATNDKIPYTDDGIAAIVGIVKSVLSAAAAARIVVGSSIVVTAPKYADISSTDKSNRNLPSVKFSANMQGAINTVTVAGTVSL